MPQPAAKEHDKIVATDTHVVQGTPDADAVLPASSMGT